MVRREGVCGEKRARPNPEQNKEQDQWVAAGRKGEKRERAGGSDTWRGELLRA